MRVFDKNDRVRTAMRSVLRGVLLTFVAFTVRGKNANGFTQTNNAGIIFNQLTCM